MISGRSIGRSLASLVLRAEAPAQSLYDDASAIGIPTLMDNRVRDLIKQGRIDEARKLQDLSRRTQNVLEQNALERAAKAPAPQINIYNPPQPAQQVMQQPQTAPRVIDAREKMRELYAMTPGKVRYCEFVNLGVDFNRDKAIETNEEEATKMRNVFSLNDIFVVRALFVNPDSAPVRVKVGFSRFRITGERGVYVFNSKSREFEIAPNERRMESFLMNPALDGPGDYLLYILPRVGDEKTRIVIKYFSVE